MGAGTYFDDLSRDWCGEHRAHSPSAGAVERASGASGFEPAFKSQLSCAADTSSSSTEDTLEENPAPGDETGLDTGTALGACDNCGLDQPGKGDEASCGAMPVRPSSLVVTWMWLWMLQLYRKETPA